MQKTKKPLKLLEFQRFGGDYWTRTSDLLRVKEFAKDARNPLRRRRLTDLIFADLQHILQKVMKSHRISTEKTTTDCPVIQLYC